MARGIAIGLAACSIVFAQTAGREVHTGAGASAGPLPGLYKQQVYFIDLPDHVRLFAPQGYSSIFFDLDGRGPERSYVHSIAIDSDGTIAVAWGTREQTDGIEIRDARGTLLRTIDTGLFVPGSVTFAADHSLWSFGWQRATARSVAHAKEFMTLRHYSPDGKEISTHLPRSVFPQGLEPGGAQPQERRIFMMQDSIGLVAFSGKWGDNQEWVEVDLNGNVRGRWPLNGAQFPGVAVTSDGNVYAKRRDPKTGRNNVVRLDRASSTWQPVKLATPGELYGADDDQLIFADWPAGEMVLHWVKQPS
jgi:hypothetical protein